MKIILLQELKGKGGEGDIVEVSRGFAVNYLFPKNIAIEATTGNLKQLEMRKHNIEAREAQRVDSAEKTVQALDGKSVSILAKVGEEGQLFGSVTAQAIAEAIAEQLGIDVDRKTIAIANAIKTAGDHEVSISIYRDVKATLAVKVADNFDETTEEVIEVVETEEVVIAEVTETAEVAEEVAE
jgi:large subunit ribosomal protein L9